MTITTALIDGIPSAAGDVLSIALAISIFALLALVMQGLGKL